MRRSRSSLSRARRSAVWSSIKRPARRSPA
jgi:hypothetical protein